MNLKIKSLKFLDKLIGGILIFACKIVPPRNKKFYINGNNKQLDNLRILIIRPGGIGDAVLLLPAIRSLREKFVNSRIDILAENRNKGIFDICEHVNNLILYDSNPFKTLVKVYRAEYDIVIDTEQFYKLTSVMSYLSRAPLRIGFDTNRRTLYTHKVAYRHDIHEIDSFYSLLETLVPEIDSSNAVSGYLNPPNITNDNLRSKINKIKKRYRKTAGIFPGATVEERKWGGENYAKVASILLNQGTGIVILGGKNEIPDSNIINRITSSEAILDLTSKTTLAETTYVISELNLLLSADSGLMHIASGLGIPTVSLFGAGIQNKWGPRGVDNIIINKELPCSPCTIFGNTPKCQVNVKCLYQISVQEVVTACNKFLN